MDKRKFIESIKESLIELLKERGISVELIVVFGSYATGKERDDSDIDIIVVSKDFRDKDIFEIVEQTKDIHGELVERFMKPFDIMYYSDLDWEEGHSLIINSAKEEGEIIYL
ncbi:MAG TPA: nucleotidyltransferase domain-containing protein [bacterium]|jgi:hypothetical protein|nr:nucleotidyltransferase domain-containing protein [bacterium]HOL55889.1 nucleotidyltransferase domain-containing protein [bacterium]HON72495.1 nucleotidyltransferase domain-containing protein [bacterium]HPC77108.1 nucleotidyltransferase domain-containing protein [bacterium]HRR92198.1 nucleotidyltransferase domain-containing protein [bacterium]